MAAADDFDTILSQMRTRIIEVTASPNPDYNVGGKSVSKAAYLATLRAEYAEMLSLRQSADNGGAWEIRGRGKT